MAQQRKTGDHDRSRLAIVLQSFGPFGPGETVSLYYGHYGELVARRYPPPSQHYAGPGWHVSYPNDAFIRELSAVQVAAVQAIYKETGRFPKLDDDQFT